MLRRYLLTTAVALTLPFMAHQAGAATTVTFAGSGQFSNLSNCTTGFPNCSITGGGTVLSMSGSPASTLTAVTINNSVLVPPNQNNLTIGELDWVNRETSNADQNFNVNYTFTLAFSSPNGSSDSQTFALNITQPTNPPGDNVLNISNATLSNLGPFNLTGVTVSDIHFSLAAGDAGTYDGTNWHDPEGSTSKLLITADFNAAVSPVPEPASLAMLGIGLIGTIAFARRRRA